MHCDRVLMVLLCMLLATPALACQGDANGDGRVEIAEVVQTVGCVLQPSAACPTTRIDAAVAAVRNALYDCTDPVRLVHSPCVQCETCSLPVVEQIGLLNGGFPNSLIPDGVVVLERGSDGAAVCLACGCPLVTLRVLVPSRDVPRLLPLGWQLR